MRRVRLPSTSAATATALSSTVMTMNTASMMSYVAASLLCRGLRGHAEVDGEDNQVKDDGGEYEDGIRTAAVAKLFNQMVVHLTEHLYSSAHSSSHV